VPRAEDLADVWRRRRSSSSSFFARSRRLLLLALELARTLASASSLGASSLAAVSVRNSLNTAAVAVAGTAVAVAGTAVAALLLLLLARLFVRLAG